MLKKGCLEIAFLCTKQSPEQCSVLIEPPAALLRAHSLQGVLRKEDRRERVKQLLKILIAGRCPDHAVKLEIQGRGIGK